MPVDPHGPPGDLDATGRALYRKLREFLKGQATWEDSDKYLLGQACRYEQRAREARALMVDPETGALVYTSKGYKGQEVPSSSLKTAEGAEKAFVDCLKELGLTPRARKQLEIEVGGSGEDGDFAGAF